MEVFSVSDRLVDVFSDFLEHTALYKHTLQDKVTERKRLAVKNPHQHQTQEGGVAYTCWAVHHVFGASSHGQVNERTVFTCPHPLAATNSLIKDGNRMGEGGGASRWCHRVLIT